MENTFQANHYFEMGLRLIQANNCRHAINLLCIAIDLDETYAEAYGYKGLAYFMLGDHQKAMKDYNTALMLDPSLEKIYYFRATLHLVQKKYEEALRDFTSVLEWDNHFAEAYYHRGICKGLLNDMKGAIYDIKFAAQLGCRLAQKILNEKGVVW